MILRHRSGFCASNRGGLAIERWLAWLLTAEADCRITDVDDCRNMLTSVGMDQHDSKGFILIKAMVRKGPRQERCRRQEGSGCRAERISDRQERCISKQSQVGNGTAKKKERCIASRGNSGVDIRPLRSTQGIGINAYKSIRGSLQAQPAPRLMH
jgi:hypothetical protein